MENKIKIEIADLSVFYENFQAIKKANLKVYENEITAFIGPSGCGKSTLLKSINRMNDLVDKHYIEGKIIIDNENIYETNDLISLRKKVGMVFQKPNLFPMSIYDNITYGPKTHGVKNRYDLEEIVEKTLTDVAIWEEVKDRLKTNSLSLSGGQQQRVCIARTLAVNPNIILMDEPTSALDPISTAKIEELVTKLKEKYTIVIVTHNMQQALRISDKTVFFLHGEVVEYGNTKDIFNNPVHDKTHDYINGIFG